MKFTTAFTTLFLALATSTTPAAAVPVNQLKRDVFDPKILAPNASTIWTLGGTFNVTWDTSDAPENISNGAAIYLRTNETMLQPALAQGFDLRAGTQEITVPANFTAATDYRVVLFGDSGNWSEMFSITA